MKEENGVNINQNMTENNLEETVEMPALAKEYVESLQENNLSNDSSQNMVVPNPEETVSVLETAPTSNEVNQSIDVAPKETNTPIELFTEVPITPAVITPINSVNELSNETNQPVENDSLNVTAEQPTVENDNVPVTPLEVAPIIQMTGDTNTVSEGESSSATETLTMEESTDVTMNTNPTMNLEQSVPVQENTNETVVTPVMDNNIEVGMNNAGVGSNIQEVNNPTEVSLTPNNTQSESMTVAPQAVENQSDNNSSKSKKNSILIGIIVSIVIILSLGVVWLVVF